MTQLRTDPSTGELLRTGGSFQRVDGAEEVAQHVRTRQRLFRGECPFNLSLGMRFVGLILAKGVAPERVEGEFIESALGTPGVVAIEDLTLTVSDDRAATVTYSGTIDLGDARRRIPLHDRFTVQT